MNIDKIRAEVFKECVMAEFALKTEGKFYEGRMHNLQGSS